jgi:hypothetical protein
MNFHQPTRFPRLSKARAQSESPALDPTRIPPHQEMLATNFVAHFIAHFIDPALCTLTLS